MLLTYFLILPFFDLFPYSSFSWRISLFFQRSSTLLSILLCLKNILFWDYFPDPDWFEKQLTSGMCLSYYISRKKELVSFWRLASLIWIEGLCFFLPFPLFFFISNFVVLVRQQEAPGFLCRAFSWRDVLTTLITVAGKERNTPFRKHDPSPHPPCPPHAGPTSSWKPRRPCWGNTIQATPVFKPILFPLKLGFTMCLPCTHLSDGVFWRYVGKSVFKPRSANSTSPKISGFYRKVLSVSAMCEILLSKVNKG